jgi:hypothetical protein
METPEQKDLEMFIDHQLKKLPEHEAPEDLVTNVFAAIAARKSAPWWKQPFTSWPRNSQAFLYAVLAMLFSGVVYFAWRSPAVLNTDSVVERASSFGWIIRLAETLGSTAVSLLRNLPWQWFVAIAVVICAMYAACVATGFALYRITARQAAAD